MLLTLPMALEAERVALGGLLNHGPDSNPAETENLRAVHFIDPIHAAIFSAILSQRSARLRWGATSIASEIATDLLAYGGVSYLHRLQALPASADDVLAASTRVLDAAFRRRLIGTAEYLRQIAEGASATGFDTSADAAPARDCEGHVRALLLGLVSVLEPLR